VGFASVPLPVLLTVMAFEDGLEPPAVAVNGSEAGEIPIAGDGAAVTTTAALALFVASARLVATT
jgi:hypothetical protein